MAKPPLQSAGQRHGGDLAFAQARYGVPTEVWTDLSTGINPNGWPVQDLPAGFLTRLPQPDDLESLLATARRTYRLADSTRLAATPGTEIAIRLLPTIAGKGAVAIVSPTYGSHAESWMNAGADVAEVPDLADVPDDVSIVVIANPNNPDGRTLDSARLVAFARHLGRRDGLLVVDEAFADVAPHLSLAPHLAGLPAIVLRSFGKFYGLPGLRLGFAAGSAPVVDALSRLLGDWPVSGPAIAIGQAALADASWAEAARVGLTNAASRLRRCLGDNDLHVVGGTDLFVLVAHEAAAAVHQGLAARGIWTRAFDRQPAWLRFGLPADDDAFARLSAALRAVMTDLSPSRESPPAHRAVRQSGH